MNEDKIKKLVELLFWDYDRLSGSGRETLDELADELDIGLVQEEIAQ